MHADPALREKAEQLQRALPARPEPETASRDVLRTGESELYPEIPDELLRGRPSTRSTSSCMREFGLRSAMSCR